MTLAAEIRAEVWEQDVYGVRSRLVPGMRVLDAGAHIGEFTNGCLALGAKAVVIEPHPDHAAYLRSRFQGTGTAVFCAALGPASARYCTVEQRGLGMQVASWGAGTVPVISLQALGRLDVAKLDIEGAEYDAVIGADLSRIGYLTLEFHVQRPVGSDYDASIGEGAMPTAPGAVQRLIDWVGRTHDVTINGNPETGGYLYAVRR